MLHIMPGKPAIVCLILLCLLAESQAQTTAAKQKKQTPATPAALVRHYHDGETLSYVMKGVNEGRRYEAHAKAVVKQDDGGRSYEEYTWANMTMNGSPVTLPPANNDFHQDLSLAVDYNISIPDFGRVPVLIGPVLDLMTFYVDLQLAERQGIAARPGEHAYVKVGGANSWADGRYVLQGEDSLDFDITMQEISKSDHTATLLIKHVPPQQPGIRLSADWMRKPVADTPNNWMEVHRNEQGKYIGSVGKETFDVHIKVDLADGKILSATMNNPVDIIERECTDEKLTNCGDPRPRHILREIELTLER